MKELTILLIMYGGLVLMTISLLKIKHIKPLANTLKVINVIASLLTMVYMGLNIKQLYNQIVYLFKTNFYEVLFLIIFMILIYSVGKRIMKKRKVNKIERKRI